ncbi:TetR/AcrR family transcriptional regulator [Embleya sp. NPDC056575]|uniref:TetR/AcrR family transcriptional regulator n=1 Tax=unclassified Embleya TaxID=2699296 RepID=UPI00367593BC
MNDEQRPTEQPTDGGGSGTGGTATGSGSGGPRKAQAIFDATLDLLADKGYEGLTIEGVAERSGVNKTTIYRWWPSKGALLGAALTGARRLEFPMPDTGSLRGDLEALLDGMVSLLTTPPTADIAVAALGAVTHSAELAEHAGAFFAGRLARERPVFERAVARGELAADADPMLLMDLLAGAAWLRVVFRQLPVEPDFTRRTVAVILDGAASHADG